MKPPDVEEQTEVSIGAPRVNVGIRFVIDGAMIISFIVCALWINSTLTTLKLKVDQLESERVSDSRIVKIEDRLSTLDANIEQVNKSQSRIELALLGGRIKKLEDREP